MKTPEEIKKDAETCMNHPYMDTCNSCRLYKECHGISDHIVKEMYDLVLHYESRLAQAERERDAAVADLSNRCAYCKYVGLEFEDSPCDDCFQKDGKYPWSPMKRTKFEWRGVCAENSK